MKIANDKTIFCCQWDAFYSAAYPFDPAVWKVDFAPRGALKATLLADKEWSIRNDACSILKDIGTARSTAALDEVARRDENGLVRKSAENAMAAIRNRGL